MCFRDRYLTLKNTFDNFDFIVIDTIGAIDEDLPIEIKLVKVPIPNLYYVDNWYKEECFNSEEGKLFEGTIAEEIKDIIGKENLKYIDDEKG